MTYPPQPPPPQGQYPYPGMPPYPPGYGMPVYPPSGGTAITAGIFAILGAVWAIIAGIADFDATSVVAGSSVAGVIWMQAIVYVVELLTLGPGSILLLMRYMTGRWLVAVGSALHIIQGIVAVAVLFGSRAATLGVSGPSAIGGGAFGLLIVLAPAIATLVLVLVPLTGRWCAWRTARNPAWQ